MIQANKTDPSLALAVAGELRRRANAFSSLLAFTQFTFPKYVINWHHKLICDRLEDVIAGKIKRLLIFTPPRHGKTELVGRRFPAYVFGKRPDARIVSASYSSDLARATNRDLQRVMDDEQYALLFPDSRLSGKLIRDTATGSFLRNTDEFEIVNHKGMYKSVGVMSGLTGRGFSIGIIDDPIKDRLEAGSLPYRNRVWEWYNSVFFTRRENDNAAIVVIQTRWHQDDLAGRLLSGQLSTDASPWTVVVLPALAEAMTQADPRKEGEALWPGLFDKASLAEIRKQIGQYEFAALYQQRPAPREGGMFKVAALIKNRILEVNHSLILRSVRYWDKAGTAGSGCMTAGVLMHELKDHTVVVGDVVAGQWGALEREERIQMCAYLDGSSVKIWTEQEPGSGGKESAENTIRSLAGFSIHADRVTGDKVARAEPFAAQVEAGNVFVLDRPWLKDYLDELELFPNGKFKDRVDASTGAFNKLFAVKYLTPHVGSGVQPTPNDKYAAYADILAKSKTAVERQELMRTIDEFARTNAAQPVEAPVA